MYSSNCPKCRRFLTPNIHKCPSCGFDRKKYYEANYYLLDKDKYKDTFNFDDNIPKKWILLISLFPIFILWIIFGEYNSKQKKQAFITLFVSFILGYIMLFLFFSAIFSALISTGMG